MRWSLGEPLPHHELMPAWIFAYCIAWIWLLIVTGDPES